VLGHYWQFPVDEVNIRIRFPAAMPIEAAEPEAYAGGRGVSNPRHPETELTREESSMRSAIELRISVRRRA